jgi:hypothetical protein
MFLEMCCKQDRIWRFLGFILDMIRYAKKKKVVLEQPKNILVHPKTRKRTRRWRRQEEEFKKHEKNKHSFQARVAKCPDLEAEVKMWLIGCRNNGILMSTKVISLESRWWSIAHGIAGFLRQLPGIRNL